MNSNRFINISNRKSIKQVLVSLCLFFGFFLLSYMSVYAYYTSKASGGGSSQFETIEVNLLDSSGNEISSNSFAEQVLSNIVPGSTIEFPDLKVKNNGTHNAYVLLNLNIKIGEGTERPLEYNVWCNVYGEEVNINNFAINTAQATLVTPDSSVTTNVSWDVPGEVLTSEYIGESLNASLRAYGVQSYLPDSLIYQNKALYASYFICKNVNDINIDTNTSANNGLNITTEPLKSIRYKNLIDSSQILEFSINSEQSVGYGYNLINLEGNYTFSFTGTASANMYYKLVSNGVYTNEQVLTNGITIRVSEGQSLLLYANTADVWSAISNIQLEAGSIATSYEGYKCHADTVDYTNKTSTQNVGVVVFDGTENWTNYSSSNLGQSFTLQLADKEIGAKTSKCSHFENVDSAWSATYINSKGIYADDTSEATFYFRAPNESVTSVALFKEYLASEYEKGNPVTVWYKLASPVSTDLYTSKNLYSGAQKLVFNTSAEITDSTDENATITITDEKLVDYIANKNLTVSANIKLDETDMAKVSSGKFGFNVQITYINSINGNKSAIQTYNLGKYDYNKNLFIWVNNASILNAYTQDQLANVTAVEIQLRNFNSSTYSGFTIKNIQLELGSSPTNFERYDFTVYARVNGIALRQVNGVKDTYNESTKTITRNIQVKVLNGTESWSLENSGTGFIECYTHAFSDKAYGSTNLSSNKFQIGTNYTTPINSIWGRENNKAVSITISTDQASTALELKGLIEHWYYEEDPLVVWYQLATPTTEQV